ncbi:Adaptor protein complex sigma subunit [Coprinopsis marcescibilis]|uniref:AP complex subunit sigma n=1 Tax=Coprinopsis marcescibilis TaxID=230819 RepID=A0A5C3LC47_COPMA|nr:Adaptor protein complex sigma subunit [Coprinopsis marcescibilis]
MINYILLLSRQGKLRLSKWYATIPNQTRTKIVREVSQLVLGRRPRMCNFLEYKGESGCIVYRRYASLFFVCEVAEGDNELIALEIIHRYVEILDKYFGNVSDFGKTTVLDELIIAGEMADSSLAKVYSGVKEADTHEETENLTQRVLDLF